MDLEAMLTDWESLKSVSGGNPESICSEPPLCSSPEIYWQISQQEIRDLSFCCAGRKETQPGQNQSKSKMSVKKRMKASEREKMRMRSLAEALHQLRDYLPPDYSKRGQPLTKIQTLKCTIDYINALSDILSRA